MKDIGIRYSRRWLDGDIKQRLSRSPHTSITPESALAQSALLGVEGYPPTPG